MKSATAQHELSGGLAGIAFLFGNILCWSAVPVILRHLSGVVDAWTANGFRYPLAGILYWPILIVAWRSNRLDARVARRCLVPSSLALVARFQPNPATDAVAQAGSSQNRGSCASTARCPDRRSSRRRDRRGGDTRNRKRRTASDEAKAETHDPVSEKSECHRPPARRYPRPPSCRHLPVSWLVTLVNRIRLISPS